MKRSTLAGGVKDCAAIFDDNYLGEEAVVDLDKIILACNQALEDSEDSFSNSLPFFEMADPQSVLELVRLVEANTVGQELGRLVSLIRDMSACLQSVPDEVCPEVGCGKKEMLSQANCVLAIYGT